MRQGIAWAAVLLAGHLLPTRADEGRLPPNLIARSGWVRFHVVLGRIEVAHLNSSQTRSATETTPSGEISEKLLITSDTDVPSVRYECQGPEQVLTIAVIGGNHAEIQRRPVGDTPLPEIIFRQASDQPLSFEIHSAAGSRRHRAASLWHLLLAAEDDFTTHLAPILQSLQPSWRFDELAAQIHAELIRQAQENAFGTHRQVRQLLIELGASDFSRRREAERQLRRLGVTALPALQQLAQQPLALEQQARLARVRRELMVKEADTPERVAAWLVEDEAIWLTLLDHRDLEVRRSAMQHLAKRLPGQLAFDPSAAPNVRTQQVAQLKMRLQLR